MHEYADIDTDTFARIRVVSLVYFDSHWLVTFHSTSHIAYPLCVHFGSRFHNWPVNIFKKWPIFSIYLADFSVQDLATLARIGLEPETLLMNTIIR